MSQDNRTILIIDDEKGVGDILKKVLAQDGYDVHSVTRGEDGIKFINGRDVHLVILDIKMPEMDGIEVLQKIQETKKNIVVIMLTAYGTLNTAREAMKLGAYDYITKPFDNEFVKEMVREGLASGTN